MPFASLRCVVLAAGVGFDISFENESSLQNVFHGVVNNYDVYPQETLNKEMAAFSIEMEIKPHYLVPDTNCFIDCLPEIEKIVKAVSVHNRPLYLLMVPVIGKLT